VARDVYPFEDFDLASQSVRDDGARIVARAFTAGPGEYDLFVAWAEPSGEPPTEDASAVPTPSAPLALASRSRI